MAGLYVFSLVDRQGNPLTDDAQNPLTEPFDDIPVVGDIVTQGPMGQKFFIKKVEVDGNAGTITVVPVDE